MVGCCVFVKILKKYLKQLKLVVTTRIMAALFNTLPRKFSLLVQVLKLDLEVFYDKLSN